MYVYSSDLEIEKVQDENPGDECAYTHMQATFLAFVVKCMSGNILFFYQ